MRVDRCICLGKTFEQIRQLAVCEGYTTVEQLQQQDICSTQCQLCKPYIEKMLETGQVSFEPGSVYQNTGSQ